MGSGPRINAILSTRLVGLVLFGSGLFAADLRAQLIRGVVSDRGTYQPVASSTVRLVHASGDTVGRTITNEEGYSMVHLERADGPAKGPWNDQVMIRSHKMGRRLQDRICSPHIWIDNVFTELMPGEGLDDAVPKDSIQAIEVYRAPRGAPARYFRDADPARACGAILIWTK